MMKDGIVFNNTVECIVTDADGNEKARQVTHNQVQNPLLAFMIDQLDKDEASTALPILGMGVGTGTGQDADAVALATFEAAHTIDSGEISQPTAASIKFAVSFTGITGTVTEAGLFTVTACTSGMRFYNDSISQLLTADDTITLNWTVTLADGN